MSSLFDVPVQLALVLSLAASAGGPEDPTATSGAELSLSASQNTAAVEPLKGPFRFSERVWLRALKESGQSGGAGNYAGRIFKTSGGRFYVPAASERDEILNARANVAVASRVARAFAELNGRRMRPTLGRDPTSGDLYLAHLFGPEVALSLIQQAKATPDELATAHYPDLLATAPETLFHDGKPVTVGALYHKLTRSLRERSAPAPIASGVGGQQGGAAFASFALKPTLVAPAMHRDIHSGALALAWRSEVQGAGRASSQ